MKELKSIKVSELEIHPLVLEVKPAQSNEFITFSMQHFGQKTAVIVIERNGSYFIIDGTIRFKAAIDIGLIKELECEVLDIPDSEILNTRSTYHQKSKVHLSEKCNSIEYMLDLIGKSQGKRNDLLGNNNPDDENEFGTIGRDRFEIVCMKSGLEFSSRTLRKLMDIHFFEKENPSLNLIDKIDSGKLKIDGAHKLMKKGKIIETKNQLKKQRKIDTLNSNVWFKLYKMCSTKLFFLEPYQPKFAMFSPPYWEMKEYRNQGEMKYGQEQTLEQYLVNSKTIIDSLISIMDKNGVIVIVLGESYAGGYKSITTQYEMMLLNAGLEILGVCEWVKSNPVPTIIKDFFRPSNEKIFVCKMRGAEIQFTPKMKPTKDGKISIKNSHKAKDGSERHFLQDEETIISNIITTPVFNKSEYKKYDPKFTHDAPCPMEIYEIFVESYTKPGDTCIDIHCGSGQGLEVFARHGCNAIGVDIDPLSIEFCEKRLTMILGERTESDLQMAA